MSVQGGIEVGTLWIGQVVCAGLFVVQKIMDFNNKLKLESFEVNFQIKLF